MFPTFLGLPLVCEGALSVSFHGRTDFGAFHNRSCSPVLSLRLFLGYQDFASSLQSPIRQGRLVAGTQFLGISQALFCAAKLPMPPSKISFTSSHMALSGHEMYPFFICLWRNLKRLCPMEPGFPQRGYLASLATPCVLM